MNNKCFALIVLACLVAEASCGAFDFITGNKEKPADFEALDNYLTKNVQSNETAANVNHLKANVDSLKEEGLRKAAKLVVEVSEMANDQCPEETMAVLNELSEADVRVFGSKRFQKVLKGAGLLDTLDACARQLKDMDIDIRKVAEGKGLGQFLLDFERPNSALIPMSYPEVDSHSRILYQLLTMAGNDEKGRFLLRDYDEQTAKPTPIKDAAKFNYALDNYLLKPCQELLSVPRLDLFIEGAEVVANLGTSVERFAYIREYARDMAWRKKTCQEFQNMDAAARAKELSEWKV